MRLGGPSARPPLRTSLARTTGVLRVRPTTCIVSSARAKGPEQGARCHRAQAISVRARTFARDSSACAEALRPLHHPLRVPGSHTNSLFVPSRLARLPSRFSLGQLRGEEGCVSDRLARLAAPLVAAQRARTTRRGLLHGSGGEAGRQRQHGSRARRQVYYKRRALMATRARARPSLQVRWVGCTSCASE